MRLWMHKIAEDINAYNELKHNGINILKEKNLVDNDCKDIYFEEIEVFVTNENDKFKLLFRDTENQSMNKEKEVEFTVNKNNVKIISERLKEIKNDFVIRDKEYGLKYDFTSSDNKHIYFISNSIFGDIRDFVVNMYIVSSDKRNVFCIRFFSTDMVNLSEVMMDVLWER